MLDCISILVCFRKIVLDEEGHNTCKRPSVQTETKETPWAPGFLRDSKKKKNITYMRITCQLRQVSISGAFDVYCSNRISSRNRNLEKDSQNKGDRREREMRKGKE